MSDQYTYLSCRTFGHAWDPEEATIDRDRSLTILRLRCARCQTTRIDSVDPLGDIASRSYGYALNYRHAGQPRSAWRMAFLSSLFTGTKSVSTKRKEKANA